MRDQGRETGGWWPKSSELKRAIAWDETADNDYITSQELSDALQKIKIFLGANIDILGFDASYMSQIEVAYQIKDSVNYMAASEEYASGWPYNEILKELVSNPDFDSKTFAQKITEIWDKAYSVKKDAAYTVFDKRTAAATDLSKTGVLAGAVNTFANELIAAKKIVPLYLVRNIIDYYGEDKNDKFGGVDLYDLAYVVRQDSDLTAASLKNAAAAVMNSLEHTVIKNMVGKGHKNSHGLSINFPKTKQAWQNLNNPDDNYENLSFCQATSWNEFLTDYYSKVTYGPQALNYVVPAPNPYDPAVGNLTIINFPDNSSINLKIYNLEGTLVRKTEGSGNSIVWDGRNENGAVVASGIYFYVAHTERDYCKGKITVIKK